VLRGSGRFLPSTNCEDGVGNTWSCDKDTEECGATPEVCNTVCVSQKLIAMVMENARTVTHATDATVMIVLMETHATNVLGATIAITMIAATTM